MNKNFDKYKIDASSTSYIRTVEQGISLSPIITFNSFTIEYPGLFILSKDRKNSLVSRLLDPGLELFEVDSPSFEEFVTLICEEEEGVVFLEKANISPAATSRINLKIIKERALYIKEYDKSLIVDDVLFTTSEFEYHGVGLFTSRKHVYLVDDKELNELKSYFSKE